MRRGKKGKGEFLNVDLDIYSKTDLAPLVRALGRKVIVLYLGREKRLFSAHLELALLPKSPDEAIRGFVRLISPLSGLSRRLWNAATKRTFNIGIQSRASVDYFEMVLAPATLREVLSVDADIVVTVYGRLIGGRLVERNEKVPAQRFAKIKSLPTGT